MNRTVLLAIISTGLLSTANTMGQAARGTHEIRPDPVPPQLRVIFDRCDANADTQLSWQEFENCWRQMRYGNRRHLTPTPSPALPMASPAQGAPGSTPPAPAPPIPDRSN